MEHNILIPLLLTLGAGLATGIGSAIAFFARRTNKRLLSFSLGLSGGVMIYVSFVELFQQAHTTLSDEWGAQTGIIVTVASFFAGILLIGISSTGSSPRSKTPTRHTWSRRWTSSPATRSSCAWA